MHSLFSEHFARKENFLTQVDPRIKIIFVFCLIVIALTALSFYLPLIIFILSIATLLVIRIPFKEITLRLAMPLGIAFAISIIKLFLMRDSLDSSLLIIFKVLGSTSIMLFLSLTSTLDKLLAAACWFKAPKAWIEICLIAYRYIFVLWEDALTIFSSQKVRLGYYGLTASFRSIGVLAGAIIIRAYDQSIATYEAMLVRGYKGNAQSLSFQKRLTLKDAIAICLFLSILAFFLALQAQGLTSLGGQEAKGRGLTS